MCNCPSCQAQNAGMNGLSGCNCEQQPTSMNGLDGIALDFTGAITGALIGAAVSYVAGWDWKVGAGVGAVTTGFVLPSMSS